MSKSRYLYYYERLICDTLILSRNVKSPMQLPCVWASVCVASSSPGWSTVLTKGALELSTGQRAKTTLAKRSIAGFNLREKSVVSCQVTLRRKQLYTFLDLLTTLIMPKWDSARTYPNLSGKGEKGRKVCLPANKGKLKARIALAGKVLPTLAKTISFGIGNFLQFPQLEPFFPQFESAKGLNVVIMIKPKSITQYTKNQTQIWGF